MCGQDGQSLIHGQSWQNDDSSVPKQTTDTEKSIHCDIYIYIVAKNFDAYMCIICSYLHKLLILTRQKAPGIM